MTLRTCNNFLKENYESPSVEVIDVENEGAFCISYGDAGRAGKSLEEDEGYYYSF